MTTINFEILQNWEFWHATFDVHDTSMTSAVLLVKN